jgi:hypothetical protein
MSVNYMEMPDEKLATSTAWGIKFVPSLSNRKEDLSDKHKPDAEQQMTKEGYLPVQGKQADALWNDLEQRFKQLREAAFYMYEENFVLINTEQAASLADVSKNDIERAVARGEIRRRNIEQTNGKQTFVRRFIRSDDLEEWVMRGTP